MAFFDGMNKARAGVWSLLLSCCLLLTSANLLAQVQGSGTVVGKVIDTGNSVIAGATVTLTSLDKGEKRTTALKSDGEYLFPNVAPGSYNVSASAPGFGVLTQHNVVVDADKNLRLDLVLKPSSVEASVTVEATNNSVDTQSATLGVLLDPDLVHNLPIDGNNVVSLAALLPGVSNVDAPTTFTGDTSGTDGGTSGPAYNVSGARNTQNLFLLDGTLWNNLYNNSGMNFPPSDDLVEATVLLNNFKAQYGRNAGSVFTTITKSGSNTFHGNLYEYLQNTALNAQDYFLKVPSQFIMNQYGATFGGPLRRDRLFFFLGYQGLRVAQTATTNVTSGGYTAASRGLDANGNVTPCSSSGYFVGNNCVNFSEYAGPTYRDSSGNPKLYLRNPLSNASSSTPAVAISSFNAAYVQAGGTLASGANSPCVTLLQTALAAAAAQSTPAVTLLNNELPLQCVNPVVYKLISKYLPQATPTQINGYYTVLTRTSGKLPRAEERGLVRVDWNASTRHTLDFRYYQTAASDILAHTATASNPTAANYEPDADSGSTNFGSLSDTWVVRPNLLNVARLAYKRYEYQYAPTDHTTLADLGASFTNYNSSPVLPAFPGLGATGQAISSSVNEDIEAIDNFTWVKGRHNMQAGVDYLHLQYQNIAESAPQFSFSGTYTLSSQADELLGLPSSETFSNRLNRSGIQNDAYFYAQDDWRATRQLTLNIGLRYEMPFRYYQPKNQNTTFIPGYQSIVYPNAVPDLAFVGDPGIRRALIPNEHFDFAPRFGFSYDVFGNGLTAIRGGFGIFYDATNALTIGVGEPFTYKANYVYPAGGVSNPLLGLPAVPQNFNGTNAQFSTPFSIFFPDPQYRGAYSEAANIGIQQSIRHAGMLEVNYVLRLGRHQAIPLDKNPAIYDCSGAYYQLNPSLYCPTPPGASTAGSATTAASYQARVRYPGFNYGGQGVVEYQSIGTSNYNGLQVMYSQRAVHGLSVTATFSYAKSMDISSNGATATSAIPQIDNPSSDYGPSDYDVKLTTGVGWSFAPVKFHYGSRFFRSLLSGWTQSGIYTAQTGQPYSVTLTTDYAFTGEVGSRQRAALVPGKTGTLPSNRHRAEKIAEWFDTTAWVAPPWGTFSSQSRNGLRGPAFIQLNLSAGRTIELPHKTRLAFRVDAVNATNTPNLAKPNSSLPSTSGIDYEAQVLSTTGGNSNTIGSNARRLQLSIKLNY